MKRRVLIVEDDDVFLRPLRRALELDGFDVLTAGSGEEALDLLKREDVDLALTDQRLPGMDGVAVVRRLKTEHPEVGVVVMTAYGTIGSAVEATRPLFDALTTTASRAAECGRGSDEHQSRRNQR